MDDLSEFCCQTEECPDYGKRGAGNLPVCMRFGKEKRLRLLYCRTCRARFSERKGTALFHARLPKRRSSRCFYPSRRGAECARRPVETVIRYSRLEGHHSKELHEELVAFFSSDARRPV